MRTLFYHRAALAATLGTLLVGAAPSRAASLPPVQMSGDVEYLSGGIGKDESTAIEAEGRQWPLTLEFALRENQHDVFTADVKVLVRDAKGRTALETESEGPFLLARLAPGPYLVEATLADKTLRQRVVVKQGQSAKAVFVWPAGTGEMHS
jgi:hypothetical protein